MHLEGNYEFPFEVSEDNSTLELLPKKQAVSVVTGDRLTVAVTRQVPLLWLDGSLQSYQLQLGRSGYIKTVNK